MKQCSGCGEKMMEMNGKTSEGVEYTYHKCEKCKEEIVDMKQLHILAEKYKTMEKYKVKLNKWGLSLGIRIPKELAIRYKLKNEKEVLVIPEKNGIMIVP